MNYFFFALTNPEAEPLLKTEMALSYPDLNLSYSRTGFLTFKGGDEKIFQPLMCRVSGVCLGKKNLQELAQLPKAWVWKRLDTLVIPSELQELSNRSLFKVGEKVMLIMMVGENEFWLGEYILKSTHFQTPGEVSSIEQRQVPSRAYYKLAEAFEAFDLPFDNHEKVLELGSSPGGASLFLLEQDMYVLGVDPAEMDPGVLKHINFKHIKKPFETLIEQNFKGDIDWIVSDINLPPGVVTKEVDRLLEFLEPRGMVLTLKLNQDRFLRMLKPLVESYKKKGFKRVELKYLPSHRQEIALIALRS
jgi:23S rRNA (cytidine2498-2'-O)-methyltransferase